MKNNPIILKLYFSKLPVKIKNKHSNKKHILRYF